MSLPHSVYQVRNYPCHRPQWCCEKKNLSSLITLFTGIVRVARRTQKLKPALVRIMYMLLISYELWNLVLSNVRSAHLLRKSKITQTSVFAKIWYIQFKKILKRKRRRVYLITTTRCRTGGRNKEVESVVLQFEWRLHTIGVSSLRLKYINHKG